MVNMEDVAFFTEKSRRIVAEVKKDILGQKETGDVMRRRVSLRMATIAFHGACTAHARR